jgi:hypothetical protein
MKLYRYLAAFLDFVLGGFIVYGSFRESSGSSPDLIWIFVGVAFIGVAIGTLLHSKIARIFGIVIALAYVCVCAFYIFEHGGTFEGGMASTKLGVVIFTMLSQLFVAAALGFAWGAHQSSTGE